MCSTEAAGVFVYMRVTLGHIKTGCWAQYEAAYKQHVERRAGMRGLRARWLLRSMEDQERCFSISLWDTLADMEAYERSDAVKREILPELSPFLAGDFVAYHCEVHVQDLRSIMPWLGDPERPR